MSPEAQRIAIAEECGWTEIACSKVWPGRIVGYGPRGGILADVPDYLTDLNAMHEAEKVLTPEQQARYAMTLHEMHSTPLATFWHRVICSTASKRAEAFLRTIGKWDDANPSSVVSQTDDKRE